MAYVEKKRTWDDDWNLVIRDVIFPDLKMKKLLVLPEGTNIIQFVERYFIHDAAPDEILFNEPVRVAHYDTQGRDIGSKNVRLKYKEFDIFVKQDHMYNVKDDRLKSRAALIAERIKYLLLKDQHICHLHFQFEDEFDMWTKVVGYKRYHITFSYKTTV